MRTHLKEAGKGLIEKRIEHVLRYAGETGIEAVFVYNKFGTDKNFLYLIDQDRGVFENCGILCDREGRTFLLTSALERRLFG